MERLIILLIFLSGNIYADDPHHEIEIAKHTNSNGTALAIAIGSQQFNWSTKAPQASIGIGSYNGSQALSVGVGKRFGRVLLNGSVGSEGRKKGLGAALSWRF